MDLEVFNNALGWFGDQFYEYLLIWILIGVGVYLTVRTGGVQFRRLVHMVVSIGKSREGAEGGVSSFQAFCVGLASRVGTGNLAGVAIALALGGPGAIFWMWIVAMIGMSTAFVEATLAQIFKVRAGDGSFRGGPAYYIQRGLGSRKFGILFAILLIFTFGFAFNMVQANTISGTLESGFGLSTGWTALLLVLLAAPILFGGIKGIAKVSEAVLPILAVLYLGLAFLVVVMNLDFIPEFFRQIFVSAFGLEEALAGTGGGLIAALMNGIRRGLFSNEAGMGSAPNTAATATVTHPVKQGMLQSFGVFLDTLIICSATAFVIMASGIYQPGETTDGLGATLTQYAMGEHFGEWIIAPMTILVFIFAFTSIFGNYAYAEVNLNFLGVKGRGVHLLRILVLGGVAVGALAELTTVWALADISMGLMALTNLTAVVLLGKWAVGALKDYEAARKLGKDPTFVGKDNPHMPGDVPGNVWDGQTQDAPSSRSHS